MVLYSGQVANTEGEDLGESSWVALLKIHVPNR